MAKGDEKKQIAGAAQEKPTAAEQQAQTAEADAATIRSLHEMIMVAGEQMAALTGQLAALTGQLAALAERVVILEDRLPAMGDLVEPVWSKTTEQLAIPQIEFDPAWLEGLIFKGSKEVKPEAGDNGRAVKRYQPFTRAATDDDVMSWKVGGDEVTIVLSDGTKHQVER